MSNASRAGCSRLPVMLAAGPVTVMSAAAAAAPEPIVGPPIATGETGVAVADPLVAVPPETPCVVRLYTADSPTGTFNDYADHHFDYTPPAGCAGPWNKVVFKADHVTTGRQFDCAASVWIGGANLHFGTTREPSLSRRPSWHAEQAQSVGQRGGYAQLRCQRPFHRSDRPTRHAESRVHRFRRRLLQPRGAGGCRRGDSGDGRWRLHAAVTRAATGCTGGGRRACGGRRQDAR